MAEKYLSKPIESPSGEIATVWDGIMFTVDLPKDRGVVILGGYLDVQAFTDKALELHTLQAVLPSVEGLSNYEAFFGEALTKLVTQIIPGEEEEDPDVEGIFYGGTIEPCPIDQHGRNLVKPIVVETGATAECWRCVSLRADLKEGTADFVMRGWKDVDSFCEGKDKATKKDRNWTIRLPIEDFETYPALYAEIVGSIISDSEHELYGATLEEV